MKLVNAYGSRVTRLASGLVTCPRCKKRRRRDRVWYPVSVVRRGKRRVQPHFLLLCPHCWSYYYHHGELGLRQYPEIEVINGWGLYGNPGNYSFNTYFLLVRESNFGGDKHEVIRSIEEYS